MELVERVGAFLGLAAFIGLGVLALLYFIQGREVKRLRDWAGRAPERAEAAAAEAEAALTGQEAEPAGPALGDRIRARWRTLTGRLPGSIGDRLPPGRYLAVIVAALVVAGVAVATSGFGLLDDDEPAKGGKRGIDRSKVEVAVLNATAATEGAPGVPGLAAKVGDEVKKLGYKLGPVTDAGIPFPKTLVMFDGESEPEADQVAKDVTKQLGRTPVEEMSGEIKGQAGDAKVAVVIGQDDSDI